MVTLTLRYKKTLFISGLLDLLLVGEKEFKFSITNVILPISHYVSGSFCFMNFNVIIFTDIITDKPSVGWNHHWMPSFFFYLMFIALNLICLELVHKPLNSFCLHFLKYFHSSFHFSTIFNHLVLSVLRVSQVLHILVLLSRISIFHYTLRKPGFKKTHVSHCSLQHYLQ